MIVRDESDEDNCKMMVMKDNYNKKISPFKFDYVNQMIKPVDVNVSFAVIDVLSTREVDLVYVLKFRFLMEYYDYRSGVFFLSYGLGQVDTQMTWQLIELSRQYLNRIDI